MAYVKIQDNIVVQKQPNEQDGFIEATEDVVCGYIYNGTYFSPPVPQIDKDKTLSDYRYLIEVGGVQYLGKIIQTDRETRANWIGILIQAQSNPDYTVDWKTSDGSFVTYSANQSIQAALTVSAHVQKSFDAEKSVALVLDQYDSTAQIKSAFDSTFNN